MKTKQLHRSRKNSFDHILDPAINFAIDQLRQRSPAAIILQSEAWTDLRRHLASRLAFALAPTLRLQRNAARAAGCSEEITLLKTIREFPEVLDVADRLVSGWLNAQTELFTRILRDQKDIRSKFFKPRLNNGIKHIRPGFSDAHGGGRSATMVEFANKLRLFYKPRSADGEQLWFKALRWLNRQPIGASFRIPKLLARSRYLWMEFLEMKSCRSLVEVRRFYFRWGAQTALAQVLGAIDLHRDNWLAVGSQPILVDLEFLGYTSARARLTSTDVAAGRGSLPALLETGLFPLNSRDRAGYYRGMAPFDSSSLELGPFNCWPRYRRRVQPPSKYLNELVQGFDAVTQIFADISLAKAFFHEVLARAGKKGVDRILFRASAQYARLVRESIEPRNMLFRGARRRALERQCFSSAINRRVGRAEVRALLCCDIPKFTTRRRGPFISWKRFSGAIAELKRSRRLLRARVLFGRGD